MALFSAFPMKTDISGTVTNSATNFKKWGQIGNFVSMNTDTNDVILTFHGDKFPKVGTIWQLFFHEYRHKWCDLNISCGQISKSGYKLATLFP